MNYHRIWLSDEGQEAISEYLEDHRAELSEFNSFVSRIGSTNSDYRKSHDYDLILMPRPEIEPNLYLLRVFRFIRKMAGHIADTNSYSLIPFTDSYVQNLALSIAGNNNEHVSELLSLHLTIVTSQEHLENFPSGVKKAIENSEPFVGSLSNIRDTKHYMDSAAIEGFYKHSTPLLNPENFKDEQVTGAILQSIGQAEKEIDRKILDQETKEELKEMSETNQKIEMWENILRNLQRYM